MNEEKNYIIDKNMDKQAWKDIKFLIVLTVVFTSIFIAILYMIS